MVWHIFKKDLRLLWPFGIVAALMQFAIVAVHLKLGVFEEQPLFSSLLLLLETLMYFGVAFLIATLVHEDSIVGMRQDWLVRPIQRPDLLGAKFLFLLLAVQIPMLLADCICGLANGFAVSQSLAAALSQNLYFLIGFTLPIFAFVSLTGSSSEALGGGVVMIVAIILVSQALIQPVSGYVLGPTSSTGVAWIPLTWRLGIYAIAALVILVLQYFRRATRVSRLVLATAVVVCLSTELVPWSAVFGWQKALVPASVAGQSIVVAYDGALGHFQASRSIPTAVRPASFTPAGRNGEDTVLYIPLKFSGIPGDSIVKVDRAIARITAFGTRRGQIISTADDPGDFEVPNDDGLSPSEPRTVHELLHVRGSSYAQLKDRPVTIDLDYSATLLSLSTEHTIPAVDGDLRIDSLGHCETRLNDNRTEVEFRCLNIGNPSQCTTAVLQEPGTGIHNPPLHGCLDDYAPYFGRYKPPDPIMHIGFNLEFRDPSDLIHYPVNESMIHGAQVLIKNYAATGHFTMHLTIPGIRLSEWAAQ